MFRSDFLKLIAALILLCGPCLGQSTFGSLTGTVVDPTGAVVPGATVTVKNQATQEARSVTTAQDGTYLVVNLDPGVYKILVEAPGFRTSVTEGVQLLARQARRLNFNLEVGAAINETVDVTAFAGVIETETPTISDSRSGREINELALNFRATDNTSPLAVATLAPGVQKDRDNQISIGGLQPYSTSFSIDGISTLNARLNGPVSELFPSVEAISEFKISAVNNSAEFAQASDLTTTTKSGSNEFHGSLYWFHQNRALNATDPFAPQDPAEPGSRLKPALVANSFGGVIGGPIVRNRTFFFFDYEGVRRPSQSTLRQVVPPDAFRNGDLSGIATLLVNPFTGQPYPNNQIPVNPTSAKALDLLFPSQNQATGASLASPNYIVNVGGNYKIDGFDVRGDHIFNAAHKVFARYTHKDIEQNRYERKLQLQHARRDLFAAN